VLHVGDDPEADIEGARAAGLRAVWLNRGGVPWPARSEAPELRVRSLVELDALLHGLQ
jgi:putative hydrolase of the HAD superfamily